MQRAEKVKSTTVAFPVYHPSTLNFTFVIINNDTGQEIHHAGHSTLKIHQNCCRRTISFSIPIAIETIVCDDDNKITSPSYIFEMII